MMKKETFLLLLILVLSACAAQPTQEPTPTPIPNAPYVLVQEENSYAPKMEDLNLKQDGVLLTSVDLSERYDLTPIRAEFHVLGSMPTTCNQLRINVNPPNAKYEIRIEIYSISTPLPKCENVFQQIDAVILLGVYSPGKYTIWANDSYVGDFSSY
jgi:hypothetical protein